MHMLKHFALAIAALGALIAAPAWARVEKLVVHSRAVEGNLEGNSPDRTVYVILPPSYDSATKRHYPVLYFLHGFTATADRYMGYVPFEAALKAAGEGSQEMIVVVPDSHTRFGGSMYSNSPTIGNFEDYIASDLVDYVDSHFRTIARREARGLAGHSMGGYGTLKLGMKHPDVFGALYAMNPCCLTPRGPETADPKFEALTLEQALVGEFNTIGNFAVAAAWSPDPTKPPFYSRLATKDGKPVAFVLAQWAANAPAAMAAQYIAALKAMKGIAIDTGDTDFVQFEAVGMHDELTRLGVAHDYDLYVGDHGNKVPERFGSKVLPFFTKAFAGVKP
ncbi:MAG: hypothetical protein RIQ99_680 [Pseudomonadota bacterium]|jgi:S-formylglutathione hydrolase FrmB